jgi:hypothetical protein
MSPRLGEESSLPGYPLPATVLETTSNPSSFGLPVNALKAALAAYPLLVKLPPWTLPLIPKDADLMESMISAYEQLAVVLAQNPAGRATQREFLILLMLAMALES